MGKAIKKAKTLVGEKRAPDGYDRTAGHHAVCTPCRKKEGKMRTPCDEIKSGALSAELRTDKPCTYCLGKQETGVHCTWRDCQRELAREDLRSPARQARPHEKRFQVQTGYQERTAS